MHKNEIIIKPLKSVIQINKIITIISILFTIVCMLNIFTSKYIIMSIITTSLFLFVSIYQILKKRTFKKNIYILEKNNLITNKGIINLKEVKYSMDKHNNLILCYENKKIKINKLSYNFELLVDCLNKLQKR